MYAKSLTQGLARREHLINGYCCHRLTLCVASRAHHLSSSLHAPPCWALPFPLLPLPLILLSPFTPGSQALPSCRSLSPCSLCPSVLLALRCTLTCHIPGLPSLGPAPLGRRFLLFSVLSLLLSHKASVSRLHCRQSEVATRALDLGSV